MLLGFKTDAALCQAMREVGVVEMMTMTTMMSMMMTTRGKGALDVV